MKRATKQKGYTLAIVLVICAFMAMTTLATFAVVLRYSHIAKEQASDLQSQVYPAFVTEEQS